MCAANRTDKNLEDNGWFVFFAPRDHPLIAGVVFVEHGGHGGVTATPIAKHVLETFFAKRDGQPLPPNPAPAGTPVVKIGAPAEPAAPRSGEARKGGGQ